MIEVVLALGQQPKIAGDHVTVRDLRFLRPGNDRRIELLAQGQGIEQHTDDPESTTGDQDFISRLPHKRGFRHLRFHLARGRARGKLVLPSSYPAAIVP